MLVEAFLKPCAITKVAGHVLNSRSERSSWKPIEMKTLFDFSMNACIVDTFELLASERHSIT